MRKKLVPQFFSDAYRTTPLFFRDAESTRDIHADFQMTTHNNCEN